MRRPESVGAEDSPELEVIITVQLLQIRFKIHGCSKFNYPFTKQISLSNAGVDCEYS